MSKRSDFIYQLVGKITRKKTKKKQDNSDFFQLSVVISEQTKVKKLNVFPDSCQPKVWQTIQTNDYLQKEYLFYCKNFMGSYYLINWKEIPKYPINHD